MSYDWQSPFPPGGELIRRLARSSNRATRSSARRWGGRILLMPHGRGSSSSSSVLAEILRVNNGPSAIVLEEPDPILVVGSLIAEALYGLGCPLVLAPSGSVTEGEWQLVNGHLQEISQLKG